MVSHPQVSRVPALHCSTAWLQAAVPGHLLQCDGLQRDDPRVRHRAAVERIHLAGAGGQQYYDMLLCFKKFHPKVRNHGEGPY